MDSIEKFQTQERRSLQKINARAVKIQANHPEWHIEICRARACENMEQEMIDYQESRRVLSALGLRPLMFKDVGTSDGD